MNNNIVVIKSYYGGKNKRKILKFIYKEVNIMAGKRSTVAGNSHYQKNDKEMHAEGKKQILKDEIRERNDERSRVSSPTK